MKVIEKNENGITIILSNNEIIIVNNALNEIINGIEITEFETRIGFSEEIVKELLDNIKKILDTTPIIL